MAEEKQDIEMFWKELYKLEKYRKNIDELDYMGDGPLAQATPKQRGYIYGLLNKLGANSNNYGIRSVREMTIVEAGEFIEQLQDEVNSLPTYQSKNNHDLF